MFRVAVHGHRSSRADYGDGVIVREGLALDRILGVPGDRVQLRDGKLFVSEEEVPSNILPLRSLRRFGNLSMQLGPNEYAIFPSGLAFGGHGDIDVTGALQQLSRVRGEDILGRVFFRLHPWRRFGRVE